MACSVKKTYVENTYGVRILCAQCKTGLKEAENRRVLEMLEALGQRHDVVELLDKIYKTPWFWGRKRGGGYSVRTLDVLRKEKV